MKRERATKILSRILTSIDSGEVPIAIREVWTFGSYVRGALEPNDLDLVLVHEPMPTATRESLERMAAQKGLMWDQEMMFPEREFQQMIKRPLRRPGERVDMLLGETLDEVLRRYPVIGKGPRLLLWTREHRDWKEQLAGIEIDASASRSPRHELLPCRRAGCALPEMDRLTAWVDHGVIAVNVTPGPSTPVNLPNDWTRRLDLWTASRSMGSKSLECAPLALWWLHMRGCDGLRNDRNEVSDRLYSHRVIIGRLRPGRMAWFLNRPEAVAHAQVFHFKRGEPREVWEFRRGPEWDRLDEIDRTL
ncbi:MAG: hypothetical protein AAGI30_04430 [Planctomycetota bacterium]